MKCQVRQIASAGREARSGYDRAIVFWRALGRHRRWQMFKLRRAIRRRVKKSKGMQSRSSASRLELRPGDWVRVKSYDEIQKTLTEGKTPDGLGFIEAPMRKYCGNILQVQRILEHFYDENSDRVWRKRRTVLLEGSTCDSTQLSHGHCDRGCLLFWNESWLERATEPKEQREMTRGGGRNGTHEHAVLRVEQTGVSGFQTPTASLPPGTLVRIKAQKDIEATLDPGGLCHGIAFVREHMTSFCGRVAPVARQVHKFFDERDEYFDDLPDAYALSGVYCSGEQNGTSARCDRGCALIWHVSWLERATIVSPVES